jgi:hypothetical protein
MYKIVKESKLSKQIINIILTLIILSLLFMDGLAIHDMFTEETDLTYEIGMIIVSLFVFATIAIYIKQRNKKSTQIQKL